MAALVCGAGGSTNSEAVDEINNSIKDVNLISDLPTSDKTIIGSINVLGYNTINDGGGGIFNYDATQSAVNNGGTIVNGWVRQYSGAISAKWFGAKGDGATNDNDAIQGAIDSLTDGGTVEFEAEEYRVSQIIVATDVALDGKGIGVTTLKLIDNGSEAVISGTDVHNIVISNMTVDGNAANHDVTAVANSCIAFSGLNNLRISNVTCQNATGYGIGLQAYPTGTITIEQRDIVIENCIMDTNGDLTNSSSTGVGFDGIDIKSSFNCYISNVLAKNNWNKGIDVRGEDVVITGCVVDGNSTTSGALTVGAGDQVTCTATVSECIVKNNGGFGIAVEEGTVTPNRTITVSLTNNDTNNNGSDGINIRVDNDTPSEIVINGCHSYENTSDGLEMSDSTLTRLIVTNSIFSKNGAHGMSLRGSIPVIISSCRIDENIGRGIIDNVANGGSHKIDNSVFISATDSIFPYDNGTIINPMLITNSEEEVGDVAVAAASTLPLDPITSKYIVTGTATSINTINKKRRFREIRLTCSGTWTMVPTLGFIKTPGNVNLDVTDGQIVDLVCIGDEWVVLNVSP